MNNNNPFSDLFKIFGSLVVVYFLIWLAAVGAVIYVAIHFISKYW